MFMGTARVCHKCREYVETGETFEVQRVIRAFEQDHKGHPVGNADLDEVESYLNVTDTYYARLAGESEEDANASDGGDLYESPDDLVTEVDVGEPENEEGGKATWGSTAGPARNAGRTTLMRWKIGPASYHLSPKPCTPKNSSAAGARLNSARVDRVCLKFL